MRLRTILPSLSLQPYVARFILVRNNENEDAPYSAKIVPRGYPAFIFTSSPVKTIEHYQGETERNYAADRVYFGGLGSGPVRLNIDGKADFIIAMLHPFCAGIFFREDALHFSENCYCVTNMNAETRELNQRICETDNPAIKIFLIEQYLLQIVKESNLCPYTVNAVRSVYLYSGNISIVDLAKKSYTCERNLRRKFNQHVGISPKHFAEVVRFNSYLKKALVNPSMTLIHGAFEQNYYDLSHLNKNFLRFIGESPQKYLSQNHLINQAILPE